MEWEFKPKSLSSQVVPLTTQILGMGCHPILPLLCYFKQGLRTPIGLVPAGEEGKEREYLHWKPSWSLDIN